MILRWEQRRPWFSTMLVLGVVVACSGDAPGEHVERDVLRWRDFLARDAWELPVPITSDRTAELPRANELLLGQHRHLTTKKIFTLKQSQGKPDLSRGLRLRTRALVKWDMQCPQWIEDYAALHKQAKSDFSAASSPSSKLMMHECTHEKLPGCPGLGDRFRGLMETFKLAVHSGRLFLLRWESSAPLEDVLQPALIDWRVQPKYKVDAIKDKRQYYWRSKEPRPEALVSGAYANQTTTLLTLTHGDEDCSRQLPGPDIGCNYFVPPALRSCVFHALFKPSNSLAKHVAKTRKELFGSVSERYLAVHLRIGGFEGEPALVRGGLSSGKQSTQEVVAAALAAARDLAAASNISAPILVLTDNDQLREQLREGKVPGFTSPRYKARHVAKVQGAQHKEALLTSVADLMLLAQASCFIGSPSGFTFTAFLWGRHDCHLRIHDKHRGITHL